MADTTWLQCTMPKPEWDKLNERRVKLGLKWSQIIPGAVGLALEHLEKHPSDVADLKGSKVEKVKPKPKEKKPKEKKPKEKKAKANGKLKSKPEPKAPDVPLSLPPTSEDIAELADIK